MVTRYYYTDPLAAAWMAKHFGMKFTNDVATDSRCAENMGKLLSMAMDEEVTIHARFIIHPDSQHLLEPQQWDVLQAADSTAVSYYDGFYRKDEGFVFHDESAHKSVKIIQRNGLSFMWPESEGI